MRIFSFSEAYGPFDCEARESAHCDDFTWSCLLSDEENNNLPEPTGVGAAYHILKNHVGIMICDSCLKLRQFTTH
jgi:hypothetical protein